MLRNNQSGIFLRTRYYHYLMNTNTNINKIRVYNHIKMGIPSLAIFSGSILIFSVRLEAPIM